MLIRSPLAAQICCLRLLMFGYSPADVHVVYDTMPRHLPRCFHSMSPLSARS